MMDCGNQQMNDYPLAILFPPHNPNFQLQKQTQNKPKTNRKQTENKPKTKAM